MQTACAWPSFPGLTSLSILPIFAPVISVTFFCVPMVYERMWELEGKKVCVRVAGLIVLPAAASL